MVPTKRRRFLWAAWWTAAPERDPFRKPDAHSGGARSREEARAEAERTAGQPLVEVDGRWAGAWVRVTRGDPPWPEPRSPRDAGTREGESAAPVPAGSKPWALALLGLAAGASPLDVKRAFRGMALRMHPDHGGTATAFVELKRAYDVALAAAITPRKRRRPR